MFVSNTSLILRMYVVFIAVVNENEIHFTNVYSIKETFSIVRKEGEKSARLRYEVNLKIATIYRTLSRTQRFKDETKSCTLVKSFSVSIYIHATRRNLLKRAYILET